MELKAILNKPYTEDERINFIVTQNHNLGYEIKETETSLEAWGADDTDLLNQAKENKYNEANDKAKEYLESGNALYEVEEGKHIEATDGNIAKIGLKSTALILAQDFTTTFPWNTKEDENIFLNALQGKEIAEGLGAVQDEVWTVKFPNYLAQIENAQTVEEVNNIVISY